MKKIMHIINCDKFTDGYIKYMIKKEIRYQHYFIVVGNYFPIDTRNHNIIQIEKLNCFEREIKKELENYDKIIVSGIFNSIPFYISFLNNKILKKTYLQFWGGDFYTYRNERMLSKAFLRKKILYTCIKRCAGIINLIPDDYTEFCKIFPNNVKHYVAPMPIDPDKRKNNSLGCAINNENNNNNTKEFKILIGNSATTTNYHLDIFQKLNHFKNEKIKIICPLSYGDRSYAKKVIENGLKIFGDKFYPITEYMKLDEYNKILNECQIGIFYNDRQQAMGNINSLISMGKKIYLRKGTSMWKDYKKFGIKVFDADEINFIEMKEFINFSMDDIIDNYMFMKKREDYYDNCWDKILSL